MAKKRAVGEGTIYRRQDGRYEVALRSLTTAGTYKRIRKYATTRAEADALLTELKQQVQRGVPVPDKTWKLGEYLDYWLENVVRIDRRPATQELYEATVRLNLKPGLGCYSLQQLTVPVVQSFVNQQLDEGSHSLRKVQIMRTVLSAALTNAMREELLGRNVARLVKFTELQRGRKIVPWTVDEIRAFMAAATEHAYYAGFVLTAIYGMRRGEVLGLRWCDVDFEKDELHIRQQLQRLSAGLIVGPVKTDAGERDFRLLETARTALFARRETQEVARLTAGAAWHGVSDDEALVFTSAAGYPIEPKNYTRSFKRLCKANGLREIRLHDMRHSLATLLNDLGVSARDAQLILGHASPLTTQQIYQHPSMEASDRALKQVEQLLRTSFGETNSSLTAGLNSGSSRQAWPSNNIFDVEVTAVLSGGPTGDRTRDTLLKRSISHTSQQRWADTRSLLQHRTCLLLLGVVAVNSGRQVPTVLGPSDVRRSIAPSASGLHVRVL